MNRSEQRALRIFVDIAKQTRIQTVSHRRRMFEETMGSKTLNLMREMQVDIQATQ